MMKFFLRRKTRRIASEATQWLLRLEQDEAGNAAAFAEWLLRSPDHVQEFLLATTFLEEGSRWLGYPQLGAVLAGVDSRRVALASRPADAVLKAPDDDDVEVFAHGMAKSVRPKR